MATHDEPDARGDQVLTCSICLEPFTWTRRAQEFFVLHGFQQPKRCPACRLERRLSTPMGRGRGW